MKVLEPDALDPVVRVAAYRGLVLSIRQAFEPGGDMAYYVGHEDELASLEDDPPLLSEIAYAFRDLLGCAEAALTLGGRLGRGTTDRDG